MSRGCCVLGALDSRFMGIEKQVKVALKQAAVLREGSSGNEANTCAVLIEPMLRALGWDTSDPTQVTREFGVGDGTKLDYALLMDGRARLFVEAKALNKNLDDPKFVAQTINYANNQGVIWCVLTNGLTYSIYKTNEPVQMQQKLLLTVDLEDAEEKGNLAEVARGLELLRPDSFADGVLDVRGERIFADQRVRTALNRLAEAPPAALLDAIQQEIGQPKIEADVIKQSLVRVLTGNDPSPASRVAPSGAPSNSSRTSSSRSGRVNVYPISHHTEKRSAAIVDMFETLDSYAQGLGADVERRSRKFYVGYYKGKRSFVTLELQKTRIWVYLALDPTSSGLPWNEDAMRDVRSVGHFGLGDTEFNLTDASQFAEVKELIALAYSRVG